MIWLKQMKRELQSWQDDLNAWINHCCSTWDTMDVTLMLCLSWKRKEVRTNLKMLVQGHSLVQMVQRFLINNLFMTKDHSSKLNGNNLSPVQTGKILKWPPASTLSACWMTYPCLGLFSWIPTNQLKSEFKCKMKYCNLVGQNDAALWTVAQERHFL